MRAFTRAKLWIRLFLYALFAVNSLHATTGPDASILLRTVDDLHGKRVAVYDGTIHDMFVAEHYPTAKIHRYEAVADMVLALKTEKVDAAMMDLVLAKLLIKNNPELGLLADDILDLDLGVGFNKNNPDLLERFNAYLKEIRANGVYKEMEDRWFINDPEDAVMPEIELPMDGPLIRVAVDVSDLPYVAYMDNRYVGFDIEMLQRFAKNQNSRMEISTIAFGSLVAALASGKVDIIADGIAITPERQQKVNFSDPYIALRTGVLAMNKNMVPPQLMATADDIRGKRVGVFTGSFYEQFLGENYPTVEVQRYDATSDMLVALDRGKTDAILLDVYLAKSIARNNPKFGLLAEDIAPIPSGVGFSKDNIKLRDQFNTFMHKIRANGVYDDMVDRWLENDPEKAVMPDIELPEEGPTLHLGTFVLNLPFVGYVNQEYTGFDIEMIRRFAQDQGYKLDIQAINFGSLINALVSGKVDLISACISITPEREKSIAFSEPYVSVGNAIVVLNSRLARSREKNPFKAILQRPTGVFEGSVYDTFLMEEYPESNIKRYNRISDMTISLTSRKIDSFMVDELTARAMLKLNPELTSTYEAVFNMPLGVAFNKNNPELREQFNEFLAKARETGVYQEMVSRWLDGDPEKAEMPKIEFDDDAPVLRLGFDAVELPFVALRDNEYVGFDLELVQRFAKEAGYRVENVIMNFPSLINALAAGKVDLITDGITITEERAKQVDFSDPYVSLPAVFVTRKDMGVAEEEKRIPAFLQKVAESFYNNVIHEKRYLLIVSGLKTTAIISFWSVLSGTLMGVLVCFMRMSKIKAVNLIARLFISILRGTPILVILMITFYIIFGSVNIDPVIVSIIAFGFNLAAYVSEMYRSGIEGVSKGQTEAGIAMGFSRLQTFLYIVAPQAIRRILPVYKGEVISLVKTTSIVGYIAVEDLTRAGDIIRSRTFDAFFPLIMVAALYFFISWLLLVGLTAFEKRLEPSRSKRRRLS